MTPSTKLPDPEPFERSATAVQKWVEDRAYRGYDPGDGLTTFLRPLTFNKLFPLRILQQLVWKFPVNIRPLIGIQPKESTKGRGFMIWGYMFRYAQTKDPTFLSRARECLDWLDKNRCRDRAHHCWGNHFDFATRSGLMPAHSPTIVWSGLIGQAVLEAFEQTQDSRYLEMAESICRWILSVPRERTATGDCLSYVDYAQSSIHNSNMLGAAMLGRTWKHAPKQEYLDVARSAMQYSCSRIRPDGSWWYGEADKYHWIDNFHTGYNLDSLKRYTDYTGDRSFAEPLSVGYRYFKATFFQTDGLPRYYHDRTYPIDIQCASQAIDTFAYFSDVDPEALEYASRTAHWTIRSMQGPSGNFYYRKFPAWTVRTPYFHWGQGTMFKALSHLCLQIGRRSHSAMAPMTPSSKATVCSSR